MKDAEKNLFNQQLPGELKWGIRHVKGKQEVRRGVLKIANALFLENKAK